MTADIRTDTSAVIKYQRHIYVAWAILHIETQIQRFRIEHKIQIDFKEKYTQRVFIFIATGRYSTICVIQYPSHIGNKEMLLASKRVKLNWQCYCVPPPQIHPKKKEREIYCQCLCIASLSTHTYL